LSSFSTGTNAKSKKKTKKKKFVDKNPKEIELGSLGTDAGVGKNISDTLGVSKESRRAPTKQCDGLDDVGGEPSSQMDL